MLTALLFAAATAFPALPQLNTTPALGSISSTTPFTFFVAGDNRPDKGDAPSDGFTALIAKMASATPAPAFVLWGGDTIKGKKSSDATTQYPLVLPYFAQLKVPVFNVPGNHELDKKGSGDCNDAPDPSGKLLTAYTTAMSSQPYGYFQYGNSAFIGINTEDSLGNVPPPSGCYNGFVSKSQLSQLQATLTALQNDATVQNIFLFMHRPVRDDNSHQMQPDKADKNTKYGKKVVEFTTAINALNNPKVAYVFASHDHRYYQATAGGAGTTGFVVTGGAGAPLAGCSKGGTGKPGAYYHYLQVGVNGTNVTVTVVPLTNTTPCGD
ncbi:MAG: metallophosphoesterase [Acidobacteriota bacterium]